MNVIRKMLPMLMLMLLAGLLAGCNKEQPPATEQPTNQQSQTESSQKDTAFTFTDTKGEHSLPQQPKQIATTVTYLTDHMIALGMTPTATVKSQNEDFPLYLKPYVNDAKIIGAQGQVSMETLLDASPDLIITDTNSKDKYENYSKIAPTVMLENGYVAPNWEEAFRATAAAFGLDAKAAEVIQSYEAQKAKTIERIKDQAKGKTLMVLRIRNDIRYYGDMDYRWLYDDFGFTRPSVFPVTSADNRYEVLSIEKLPQIDPDFILLVNDNDAIYNDLQDMALWKNMKAVKNNQVYPVSSDSWFGGYGPHAATSMLDDLARLFEKK